MRSIFGSRTYLTLVAALVCVTLWGYWTIPMDRLVPVHWDIAGEPDNFAPAGLALLIAPTMAALVALIVWTVAHWSAPEKRQARKYIDRALVPAITALAVVMQIITINAGSGGTLPVFKLIASATGVLFVILGNVLPKSQRNWVAGIRIPPTLADDANWQATHRIGGWLYLIAGVLLVVFALAVSEPTPLLIAVLAAALGPAIIATSYSYWFASRVR